VEDIPLLVEYLIQRYASRVGKRFRNMKKNTCELLQAYDWPGNIRELQNVIERAVILCEGETFSIEETWLKREPSRLSVPVAPLAATLADREREVIEAALAQSKGRISGPSGAAAKLGVPRQTLDSKIANLQISKLRFKVQSAIEAPSFS
jgi:formate hydrogenlyase transcriptional activator